MSKITLGYWDIRGLAEPIRFLLHYKKVKFEDKKYQDRAIWFEKDKFNLGLDFPNLPYYIEGDVKMSQTLAILRYLAEKYDLGGKTREDRIRLNMAEQQFMDLMKMQTRLCYDDGFESKKAEFIAGVPAQFLLLETFLGDRKFLNGDQISYVDFFAYHVLDFYRLLIATVFDGFPKLKSYQQRILSLPELQEYLKTEYKVWPIFGPLAKFGGGGPAPSHA